MAAQVVNQTFLRETMTVATPAPAFPQELFTADAPQFAARKIRALIVDDQLLAREVLRRMLRSETDIEIIATPANGREAVEAINRLRPDLVFLDVQMPELDGFGVMTQIDAARMPVVIFVTANQQFALKAFDVQALDYLLKPCTRDRFQLALQRAREEIQRKQAGELHQRISELIFKTPPRQAERITVKSAGKILFLRLDEIIWVEAADNYVKLHVGEATHQLRDTMAAVEARLPAERFVRISRSSIVNLDHLKELHPLCHGEYAVLLQNGTQLTLTRGYKDKLRQLLTLAETM
jgi:two-component system, LytTR family, response regulator